MTPEIRSLLTRMADELDRFTGLLTDNRCSQSDLATEARNLLAQPEWQPMESAPKDGTLILVHDYDTLACVSWDGKEWESGDCEYFWPGGWQHLPAIPDVPQ